MSITTHILGGGSIGLLWAASLRSVTDRVCVLLTNRHSHRIHENQITICLQQQQRNRVIPVTAYTMDQAMSRATRPIENLLVTTKAFDASTAVQSLSHRLDAASNIIVLCNGALAVADELRPLANETKAQIKCAWTSHGAYRTHDDDEDDDFFHVIHAGRGKTELENDNDMASLWTMAGLTCQSVSHDEMQEHLWYKLAANCVINPLTAIHKCTNGALLTDKSDEQKTMLQVINEVAAVYQHETKATASVEEDMRKFVRQVMKDTSANKSSMLQDVLAARRTEVDYLNGFVVRKAKAQGLDCTANEALCDRIRELEDTMRQRE